MADPYGDMIRGLLLARMNRPAMERARSGLFANLPKDSERVVDPFGENPFEDDGVIEELPHRRTADPYGDDPFVPEPEIFRRRRPALD